MLTLMLEQNCETYKHRTRRELLNHCKYSALTLAVASLNLFQKLTNVPLVTTLSDGGLNVKILFWLLEWVHSWSVDDLCSSTNTVPWLQESFTSVMVHSEKEIISSVNTRLAWLIEARAFTAHLSYYGMQCEEVPAGCETRPVRAETLQTFHTRMALVPGAVQIG